MDALFIIILVLAQLAVVGGIIYAIYAWRRRGQDFPTDTEHDPGLGTLKRIYFYAVSFAALMVFMFGISLAVQSLLNALFDGKAFSLSSNTLAWGLSLFIVGLPIWAFHWRFILRNVAAMPVERRSIVRKLYIYLTLGVGLAILAPSAYEIIKWAMRAGEFPEFSLASILPWAMVWGYHWQIESDEGQDSMETRGIRRLYLYVTAFSGAIMLAVGAGSIVHTLLQDGYSAMFLVTVALSEQNGLARESLRSDLALAIAGGAVYWAHWHRFAFRDRDSILRWIFLFLATVGGAVATLTSGGVVAFTTLSWLFGAASERAAIHFDDLPGTLVVLSIGLIAWSQFRHRTLIEAIGESADPIRRIYDHLMSALGLAALAGASFMIFNTALVIFADSLSATIRDSGAWRSPVAAILAMLIIGVPVWSYHWRRLRLAANAGPESEATALSHRVYIFAVMGAGALAFLGGGGGTLFVILRDILDAELSAGTLRDLTPTLGSVLTAALFLPYHWTIYRADQTFLPDDAPPKPRAAQKRVTLLTTAGGSALAQTIEDTLGYSIREARWFDSEAFAPTLDGDEIGRIAGEISQSGGSNVLLIPEADGLKVISYD